MAIYDSLNDKIWGAKPGTLVYFHEEGHRAFRHTRWAAELSFWGYMGILFCLAELINGEKTWASAAFIFVVSLTIAEEVYAWIFAFNKRWKQ